MPGVARRLFYEVQQNPPDCAALGIGKPGCHGQGYPAPQVVDFDDGCIGMDSGLFVLPDRGGKRLVL
jgi:hypothetical protein